MPRKLDNWLLAYRDYTQGTESPESFHLWAGLSTIAAAAQRKIRLRVGGLRYHSNLLVVLVGPAGGPRKTTALDRARALIKRQEPDLVDLESHGIKLEMAPESASGAAIIRRLASIANREHQSMSAFLGELGTLIKKQDEDMVNTLTNFWDCRTDFEKDTVGRGAETITAPWLNILAATTPVWLSETLSSLAVEGGLVSRGLWVYEDKSRGRIAKPPAIDNQLHHLLVHDLADIARQSGWIELSDEADKRNIEWYEREFDKELVIDPRFSTHRERKQANILKVAMLLALARGDMTVELEDFENARALVSDLERGMLHVFQGVGKNIHSMDYERIKAHIRRSGSVHYKELIARNIHSIDKQQIDSIIITLVEAGEIRREGQTFHAAA
jgi:hypothetical protein